VQICVTICVILFFFSFPDVQVRQCAIDWMSEISSDDMVDYLPQLLEALKHETWSVSPLAKLLLQRALKSPRVAHSLYWLLAQGCRDSSTLTSFCMG
jgi:phosphatidylinositol-4-phosphate 3-kinase